MEMEAKEEKRENEVIPSSDESRSVSDDHHLVLSGVWIGLISGTKQERRRDSNYAFQNVELYSVRVPIVSSWRRIKAIFGTIALVEAKNQSYIDSISSFLSRFRIYQPFRQALQISRF